MAKASKSGPAKVGLEESASKPEAGASRSRGKIGGFGFRNRVIGPERTQALTDYSYYQYIPFFDNRESELELLTVLPTQSQTHASCIESKTNYSIGGGFVPYLGKASSAFAALRGTAEQLGAEDLQSPIHAPFVQYIERCNAEGQSLLEVTGEAFTALFQTGNVYLHLRARKVSGQEFVSIYTDDPSTVRLSSPQEGKPKSYKISPQWDHHYLSRYMPGGKVDGVHTFEYAAWPGRTNQLNDAGEVDGWDSIIHIKRKQIGWEFYGMPSSVSAMMEMLMEYYIPSYNVDEFKSGLRASKFIQFISEMSEKEAEEFVEQFLDTYTGDGGDGIVAQVTKQKADMANVIDMKKDFQGSYLDLGAFSSQAILTAHQWHPSLAGIATPGKLGDTQEMLNAYLIAMANVIVPAQNKVMKHINIALSEAGFESYSLAMNNPIPVQFFGRLNPDEVMLIDEQRDEIGLRRLENDERNLLLQERETRRGGRRSNARD